MKSRSFALGALIGVAAGVVAGLLTAPRSGKVMRTDMKRQAKRLKAKVAKRVR